MKSQRRDDVRSRAVKLVSCTKNRGSSATWAQLGCPIWRELFAFCTVALCLYTYYSTWSRIHIVRRDIQESCSICQALQILVSESP
ncbi:hypothetical protein CONLIGDRAFT_87195 [Coniochaeta ligniaria NRRL 30616]|uniref:Uncharacterized protein n=1 Tax=Coniochaeta ligniaria NRRL 30616 TaxID=1408157 RepID=A0A1J7ICV2_9PEZI|nr:hypothetical protein CONLIGDRAFT_87195 [Coniochaeta ligniaria NRRL 30616]